MGARDLLGDLAGAGLRVTVEGGGLVIRPASLLTDDLRQRMRAAKPELVALLSRPAQLEAAPVRRYRLSAAESEAAHADPWDDGAIARFQARAGRFGRLGFSEADAEDLAERLHLRDATADFRHLCLECRHFRPWRCGSWRAAGLQSADVGPDMAVMPQGCDGFKEWECG